MKRRIPGLNEVSGLSANNNNDVPDGIFLVRVDKAQYRWHAQKPFYTLRLSVLEPHCSWSWEGTYAKCGRVNTGGWRI